MRFFTPLVALAGVAALALTGCTGPGAADGGSDGELATGGTFTMAIGADPGNLNPMVTAISTTRAIDRFLYARLIDVSSDGTIEPGLASEWDADTTTATFTLREGTTCSDGTAITASMVADNINFIADPENGSPLIGLNVQPGTVATGDDAAGVVSVASGQPDSFLLQNLGGVHVVCGPSLTDPDGLAKGEGATGMYTMTNIAPNSDYTLTLRDDFTWGPEGWDPKQAGIPETVVFKVLPNETTAANLLLAGELNAAAVAGPDAERVRAQKLFSSDVETGLGQLHFNKNPEKILTDEAVRIALVEALNLDELRTVLTSGTGTAPTSLVTMAPNPCSVDIASSSIPAFDAKAAAAGLDAAGWALNSDGIREKDGVKLSLSAIYPTYSSDTFGATGELMQSMWAEVGVDITLKGVDSNGLSEAFFATGDWDLALIALNVGLPSEIVPFYSGANPPDGANFGYADNAGFNTGIAAGAEQAGTDGCSDWLSAQGSLMESADVIPFANSVLSTFGSKAEFDISDSLVPTSIRLFK